ncbi:MAG: prepilin-type N-terminal cleavage/methylation domain-containing protein [Cyanobacteria bacterium SIG28]|nr:prepilin-type N-terminal cleavage/methylation domain-containing protein [Cyanobacteria bacterium SIG28]
MRVGYKKGFNLSELLIVLFIIGVVAAYTVPMLGMKRTKNPNDFNSVHGLFMCYYDRNDNLRVYRIESNNTSGAYDEEVTNASTLLTQRTAYKAAMEQRAQQEEAGIPEEEWVAIPQVRNTCTFEPPKANYFMVYAIGAGGDGFDAQVRKNGAAPPPDYEEEIPTVQYNAARYEVGSIPVGTGFKKAMESLPPERRWVKDKWDLQWDEGATPPQYTIRSSRSDGGDSYCRNYLITSNKCSACADEQRSCPVSCFEPKSSWGGDSGRSVSYVNMPVKIKSNFDISFSTGYQYGEGKDTILKFNSTNYIKLKPPGIGASGSADYVSDPNGGPPESTEHAFLSEAFVGQLGLPQGINHYRQPGSVLRGGGKSSTSDPADPMRGCSSNYQSISGSRGGIGSFTVTPEVIQFRYTVVAPKIMGIKAGKTATPNIKVFEQLPRPTYVVRPGIRLGWSPEERASEITTEVPNPKELDEDGNPKKDEEGNEIDPGSTIVSIHKAGGAVDAFGGNKLYELYGGDSDPDEGIIELSKSKQNVPLPRAYRSIFIPQAPTLTAEQFMTTPLSKKDIGYIPGKGGWGSFPILSKDGFLGMENTFEQIQEINGEVVDKVDATIEEYFDDIATLYSCSQFSSDYTSGSTVNVVKGTFSYNYCKGTKGQNGAVIIIW